MKILWIAFVWPEPTSSAAGFRTLDLINSLRSAGHEVKVTSPCVTNEFRGRLDSNGIETYRFEPNDSDFDKFLLEFSPQVVFFDRFMIEEQFGWRVREHTPGAIRILDTVDLQSLRRTRESKVKLGLNPALLTKDDLHSDAALREVAAIYRSDLTLIVSKAEISLLVEDYGVPTELLEICSFFYPSPTPRPEYEARSHFVSIGNFNHSPNSDSFRVLHTIVWPKIRLAFEDRNIQAPELHIYGAYPTREFMGLTSREQGFHVLGPTENSIETLSRYRVNLAPLRFGAGIKGKISDGWAAGTPCVTTSMGAEGMSDGLDFGGIIEDDLELLAEKACDLFLSEENWSVTQARGYQIISSFFEREKNVSSFLHLVEELPSAFEARRQRNFVGKMLWHQSLRSTEYFSRWIEVKKILKSG